MAFRRIQHLKPVDTESKLCFECKDLLMKSSLVMFGKRIISQYNYVQHIKAETLFLKPSFVHLV